MPDLYDSRRYLTRFDVQRMPNLFTLEPLPVVDVGLGAVGRTRHLARVDQPPLEACAVEEVVERYPGHTNLGQQGDDQLRSHDLHYGRTGIARRTEV